MQAAITKFFRQLLRKVSYDGMYNGYVVESNDLCKQILQGTVAGRKKKARPKKRWEDNIKEWTGLDFNSTSKGSRGPSEMADDCSQCHQ